MKKSVYLFHILGLNLNISYQIVSLFDMYMDMGEHGERIAGKQDRPSLIIEDPPQSPLNSPKYTFFISRGAGGPGREILQCPPSVRPSVCLSVCPSVCLSVRHV